MPILKLAPYPREELEIIHSATLKVLRNVGVKFPDKKALEALKEISQEQEK